METSIRFESAKSQIALEDVEKFFIISSTSSLLNVDNIYGGTRLEVRQHRNGLVVDKLSRYRYVYKSADDKTIIPGQYDVIYEVANFIVKKAKIDSINQGQFIKYATDLVIEHLKSSGLWLVRGKTKWSKVPDEFWKAVTLEDFISYSKLWNKILFPD